jgi:hypothetical protein
MWIKSPRIAAPGVNQNEWPAIACCMEVIMAVDVPTREEMWNRGVKNPWC